MKKPVTGDAQKYFLGKRNINGKRRITFVQKTKVAWYSSLNGPMFKKYVYVWYITDNTWKIAPLLGLI